MQRYAYFDNEGLNPSFYDSIVFPPDSDGNKNAAIPNGAVELTFDQWDELQTHMGHRKWLNGEVVTYDPPAPPPEPPKVSGDAIISTLTNAQAAQVAKDALRISWRDDVPVTNPKLVRIAKAIGKDPVDLWNLAAS